MEIGISTSLSPKSRPKDVIEIANEMELEYIELFFDIPHFPPKISKSRIEEIKENIESYGLKSRIHGQIWDLNPTSHYREIRELSLEKGKETIKTCNLLNGDLVTFHPGKCWGRKPEKPSDICKDRFEEYVKNLSEAGKKHDITISIETSFLEAEYPSSNEEFLNVTKNRENLGVTLDIGHSFISKQAPKNNKSKWIAGFIEELGDNLTNVHIHDNNGDSDLHLPPKSGKIDFRPIIKALKDYYNGPLILELWGPKNPVKTVKNGINNLRELLSQ